MLNYILLPAFELRTNIGFFLYLPVHLIKLARGQRFRLSTFVSVKFVTADLAKHFYCLLKTETDEVPTNISSIKIPDV